MGPRHRPGVNVHAPTPHRRTALIALAMVGLCAAPVAPASVAPRGSIAESTAAGEAAGHRPLLGLLGGRERFDALTGQRTRVGHVIFALEQSDGSAAVFTRVFAALGEIPMLGINTHGAPLQIAQGRVDATLLALNAAIAEFSGPIYVRPFGEMNGHWNAYCAFSASGASKGPAYSTAAFRKAST
jgi:hypothetical protein